MSLDFSEEEILRYSRNVILAEVGWTGQQRLRSGRVLVVGAGGIGSATLLYLAAAGVGHLGIADGDEVELSNLQRQILHRVEDLGRRKVESARDAITALNPHCTVQTYDLRLRVKTSVKFCRDTMWSSMPVTTSRPDFWWQTAAGWKKSRWFLLLPRGFRDNSCQSSQGKETRVTGVSCRSRRPRMRLHLAVRPEFWVQWRGPWAAFRQ